MIQVYERREFERFLDVGGQTYANIEFRHCKFISSRISITENPAFRSVVRNVKLIDCEVLGCALNTAVVEEVTVEGLKTNGLFQTWGAVFKHVTLKGKIGRIMLSPAVATGTATPEEQQAFDKANGAYYANVDWALDIREADFQEADIRDIPASLILRDPKNHFVVKRKNAQEGTWEKLDLSGTYWATAIKFFLLDSKAPDIVLVAPKRHPKYIQLLEGLKRLRDAGVAEPN
jgi:hypothetical protein